jgi:two-component system OmpR family response regulator
MSERSTVLVVDDDRDILALLEFRLRRDGYEVLTAHDGDEALALARRHRPAATVLDVAMPGLDGLSLARSIRAELTETRLLFLTARASRDDIEAGLAAGADDYITKPFSPAMLAWRLAELLAFPSAPLSGQNRRSDVARTPIA